MIIRRVLDAATFLERLTDELERGRRYERPFSLVLFRAPVSTAPAERLRLLDWGASVARNHVRSSDAVGVFEEEWSFAICLPETTGEGAAVVRERFASLDRLAERRGANQDGWVSESFSYPEAGRVIEAFIQRRSHLLLAEERPLSVYDTL